MTRWLWIGCCTGYHSIYQHTHQVFCETDAAETQNRPQNGVSLGWNLRLGLPKHNTGEEPFFKTFVKQYIYFYLFPIAKVLTMDQKTQAYIISKTQIHKKFEEICCNIKYRCHYRNSYCDSWRIKDQLDVTCYVISLLMRSTCFGH